MPSFVVEDGTGMSTATSLCSVADADDHFTTHPLGTTRWASALTTGQKQSKLMQATAIAARELRWRGSLVNQAQALPLPASGLYDHLGRELGYTSVPADVAKGIAELAGLIDSQGVIAGGAASVKSKSTGPTSVAYGGGGNSAAGIAGIPGEVIRWLRPYIYTEPLMVRA